MEHKEDLYRWFRNAIETHVTERRRPQVLELLAFLWKDGTGSFFVAPASSKYHLNELGGLCRHSRNVIACLLNEVESLFGANPVDAPWEAPLDPSAKDILLWRESAVIVGLCHDLNKMKLWGKHFYTAKMVQSKDKKSMVISTATPYEKSGDRVALGSVDQILLAAEFISLKPDEVQAIRYIEGLYDYSYKTDVGDKAEILTMLAHWADMKASQILEWNGTKSGEGWSRDHFTWRDHIDGTAPEPDMAPDPLDLVEA